jgi:hypothetical protein
LLYYDVVATVALMRAPCHRRLKLPALIAIFCVTLVQPDYPIFAQGTVPGGFSKLTPSDAAAGQSTTLLLQWESSSGAASYEYCLDTTLNAACDGSWIDTDIAVAVVLESVAAGATYEWQVRARNSSGTTEANAGAWWRFSTRLVPLGTYFLDDLETAGTLGWGRVGPWAVTTESAHSPTHAWSDSPSGTYEPEAMATIFSPTINLQQASAPALTFWHRFDFAADGFDRGLVRITTDGGASYTELQSYTGTDATWRQVTIDLTPYAGASAVNIVFEIVSNGSQTGDGWYLDDIRVAEQSFGFSDDPLLPGVTTVRRIHVSELRIRIDAARVRLGLSPFAWTDPVLIPFTGVQAQHIVDMRTALLEAYSRAGLTPPTFTDSTIAPQNTVIRAVHVQQLRSAVAGIE